MSILLILYAGTIFWQTNKLKCAKIDSQWQKNWKTWAEVINCWGRAKAYMRAPFTPEYYWSTILSVSHSYIVSRDFISHTWKLKILDIVKIMEISVFPQILKNFPTSKIFKFHLWYTVSWDDIAMGTRQYGRSKIFWSKWCTYMCMCAHSKKLWTSVHICHVFCHGEKIWCKL